MDQKKVGGLTQLQWPTLEHESTDDPVENGTFVAKSSIILSSFAPAEFPEVLRGLWRHIFEQLDYQSSSIVVWSNRE